ncbi:PREDICTED: uncharacterized protein LOC107110077 [Gekko japonicus]|uniref:Uncharacterized protein LOC107110077 n=1 Tax=Gekko japonicus TaxID=146911 RepID=A0ABM1JXU7_GEKJA|nr:PREDICTED: uncharacterized protein LOC107110077 [Gekko japonicus]
MLGSRVCWQLLLGWALLLGQPVFGDSGSSSSEQRSLQEPENPAPGSEEPENAVAEGPEKPLPESEEPEDLLPELDEPEQQVPVQEELEEKPLSDEELEEMEKDEREWLKQEKEKPCGSWLDYLQAIALGYYNKERKEYYKPDGRATLRTKKAIGTMISLKVVLMRTNCTRDQLPEYTRHGRLPFHIYRFYAKFPENCESLKGSEQECTFTLFGDQRRGSFHDMAVVSDKCSPMHPNEERHQRPRVTFRS